MNDKILLIINKDGKLVGTKAQDILVLCIFGYLEDAERYLISWNQDPGNYKFLKGENWNEILSMLKMATNDFEYATLEPPMSNKRKFRAFRLQGIVNQIEKQIHHPYS